VFTALVQSARAGCKLVLKVQVAEPDLDKFGEAAVGLGRLVEQDGSRDLTPLP